MFWKCQIEANDAKGWTEDASSTFQWRRCARHRIWCALQTALHQGMNLSIICCNSCFHVWNYFWILCLPKWQQCNIIVEPQSCPLISKLACKKEKKKNLRRKMPQIPLNDSLGQPDWAERRYFGGSHSIMTLSPKLLPCFLWAGPSPSLTVDTMEGAASCLVIKPIPAPPAKIPNRSRVNPVFTACKQIPGITVGSLLLF